MKESSRGVWLGVLLLLLLFALIVSVPYSNPSGDAVNYALSIRDNHGTEPANPNRLLLLPTLRLIHDRVVLSIAPNPVDPIDSLLWIARFSFLLSGIALLLLAQSIFRSPRTASIVAIGYSVSHAILLFASDGEPILLGHLPLIIAALIHMWIRSRRSPLPFILAGTFYGISILFLISNAFAVAVLGVGCMFPLLKNKWTPHILVLPAAVTTTIVVLIVYFLRAGTSLSLVPWIFTYSGGGVSLSYGGLSMLSLFRLLFGFGNGLVASRGAARFIRHQIEGTGSISAHEWDWLIAILWVVVLIVTALLVITAYRRKESSSRDSKKTLTILGFTLTAFLLFNLFWIGSDPQFWVPVLPALWILFGYAFHGRKKLQFTVLPICILFLLPFNMLTSVLPQRGNRENIEIVESIIARTESGSLIIVPGLNCAENQGIYHPIGDRDLLSLWRLSTDPRWANNTGAYYAHIDSLIESAVLRSQKVYLEGILTDTLPLGIPWREMRPRGFSLADMQKFFKGYRITPAFHISCRPYWLIEQMEADTRETQP